MNMLRDRSEKLPDVTEEKWECVLEHNRKLVEEFLEINTQLSKKSILQYRSALKQFFYWVYEALNNKPMYKITKRDFLRYISYLDSRGMSSSGKGFKKSAVSSLCNYIENVLADEVEEYKTFRTFTKGLPPIPKNRVYDKKKVTREEYELMMETLQNDENYLGMAWLATAFNTGARRAEIVQFKTEILDYDFADDKTYILSHIIRLKGAGEDGKQEKFMINKEAIEYMKMWVEKRGYDHEYIFTIKFNGEIVPMRAEWGNSFCINVLSDIVGRRINPHLFKASAITHLLESGIDIAVVSKYVAHHNDVSTTSNFYDLRDFEEERNSIFE